MMNRLFFFPFFVLGFVLFLWSSLHRKFILETVPVPTCWRGKTRCKESTRLLDLQSVSWHVGDPCLDAKKKFSVSLSPLFYIVLFLHSPIPLSRKAIGGFTNASMYTLTPIEDLTTETNKQMNSYFSPFSIRVRWNLRFLFVLFKPGRPLIRNPSQVCGVL